jgi:3-methylcrotonyl-CoA carboxylase alpha subunit
MEARLYAEDPAKGFLPSVGRLEHFRPGYLTRRRRFRIETGVEEGGEISPFYDPMIAKLVTHAESRELAIGNLCELVGDTQCWPVKTNAGFLNLALWDEDFVAGNLDTGLIARRGDEWIPDGEPSDHLLQSVGLLVVDEALGGNPRDTRDTYLRRDNGPWSNLSFRLNREQSHPILRMKLGELDLECEFREISVDSSLWVERVSTGYLATENGETFVIGPDRTDGGTHHSAHDGDILSPMPGKIIAVEVAAGDTVTKGQKLLTLEAMKMEHTLVAPFDGVVAELSAVAGSQVQVEALLARIEAGE